MSACENWCSLSLIGWKRRPLSRIKDVWNSLHQPEVCSRPPLRTIVGLQDDELRKTITTTSAKRWKLSSGVKLSHWPANLTAGDPVQNLNWDSQGSLFTNLNTLYVPLGSSSQSHEAIVIKHWRKAYLHQLSDSDETVPEYCYIIIGAPPHPPATLDRWLYRASSNIFPSLSQRERWECSQFNLIMRFIRGFGIN